MKRQLFYTTLAAATALGLASCTTDVLSTLLHENEKGDPISFTVTDAADDALTRAALTRADDDPQAVSFRGTPSDRPLVLNTTVSRRAPQQTTRGLRFGDQPTDQLTAFGVSAILTSATVSDEDFALATPSFFYNLKAEKNADTGIFQIAQDYYWPASSEKLWFYAWAPYGDADHVAISEKTATGPQKLTFTVDADVTKQVDLMTASQTTQAFNSAAGDTKKSSVALTFRHELTAVRFVIGEQWIKGNIKSVAIRNVHGKGTLTIGGDWAWKDKLGADLAATDGYELTLERTDLNGTKDENFMDGDFASHYFLMLPQSFDDNDQAVIEVKYQDKAEEYTVTAPLKGQDPWVRNTTVTYAISSRALTKLKIGDIAWPDETADDAWQGPKTAFAANDSIGLYVVEPDGKTIPESHRNVKCTYNGTAWTIHHPEGDPVYKLPGYQYFFYYPYTPLPDTKYPMEGQESTNTTAAQFFSSLVLGWDPARQQDTRQKLDLQDLQIAKAADDELRYSTVNAQMAHQMNIGIITLGQKDVTATVIHKLDDDYKWIHGLSTTPVTASADFDTRIPFTNTADGKYYYVFKPVTDAATELGTQMKALRSETTDWSAYLKTAARGTRLEREVLTSLPNTTVEESYTLAVGDVYYSNGAISHEAITGNSNYGTPAGIVFALNGDMSTADKSTNGFTHGYVFSLKDANAYRALHKWYKEKSGDVSAIPNVTWSATTNSAVTEPVIKDINGSGQNGYQNTKAVNDLNALSDYPAFQAVSVYNTTTCPITATQTNSGWYLPSIAEWWLVCKNLGKLNTGNRANDTSWKDSNNSLWGVYYSNNSANSVHTAINTALAKAGTKGTVYNPIRGGSAADAAADMSSASGDVYWSSSEWSGAGYAFCVHFGSSGALHFRRDNDKSVTLGVRPILAF